MFTLIEGAGLIGRLSTLYLVKEVIHEDISILGLGTLLFLVFFLPSLFIFSYIAKKTEHIYVSMLAMIFAISQAILIMFITNATGYYFASILSGLASAAWAGILFSITSDVMDSVCIDADQHVESTMIGIRTFFLRTTYLIGGALIAIIHIMTGYVPGATSQSPSAQFGIRLHAGLIPGIMALVALILVLKFYTLKGDRKRECMETLRAKGL
jgi:GPH family glycoside/pentoside/hexuronide:cation symporter